jgi:hypothetical protein
MLEAAVSTIGNDSPVLTTASNHFNEDKQGLGMGLSVPRNVEESGVGLHCRMYLNKKY